MSTLSGLPSVVYYPLAFVACYIVVVMTFASAVSSLQEAKLWKPAGLPSLSVYGHIKVFLFNIGWMSFCLFGSIAISIKFILTFGTSDIEEDAYRLVEKIAAKIVFNALVGHVEVVGTENLPPIGQVPAPVYVANHASQIDTAVVYFFDRRFKWIAKSSILFVPGVGLIMKLGGHVLINRKSGKNKSSLSNLFDKSNVAVQAGIPMFFFPQGTRRMAEKLPFKDGAFIVAETSKSVLVPVSIDIPRDAWNHSFPVSLLWTQDRPTVVVTIHKPIPSDADRETVKRKCEKEIYSVLPASYGESAKEK